MSSPNQQPSKPVAIGSPPSGRRVAEDSNAVSSSHASQSGEALERFRTQFGGTPIPNIPPRVFSGTPTRGGGIPQSFGSPGRPTPLSSSPRGLDIPALGSPGPSGSGPGDVETPPDLSELPDEEKARILRRHLVSREERQGEGWGSHPASKPQSGAATPTRGLFKRDSRESGFSTPSSSRNAATSHHHEDTEPFPIPFAAPGGDVTHEIYKWQSDHRRAAMRNRAASFSGPDVTVDPTFAHIHEPGGFRRNYLLLRANQAGAEQPQMVHSFIDFLYIFGHFAGEDLEEDEDEDGLDIPADEDLFPGRITPGPSAAEEGLVHRREASRRSIKIDTSTVIERTPLLTREGSAISPVVSRKLDHARRARRSSSMGPHGDATVPQAILMLLKSFIGTGVLFLGKAFYNGGILFSSITLVGIALISLYSFLLLVKTKFVVSGSFGDIGGTLYGPYMRYAILTSIVVSQLGFVCTYTIFVSENLQAFVMAISKCRQLIPIQYFIFGQLIMFVPLALIRNIAKLSGIALVADAFILIGLVYIGSNEVAAITDRGFAKVALFNPKDFPLLIGTSVFSFEGIGLVIPITDSMREPRKFPKVLTGVMLFLTVLFTGAGALSYATYGSEIKTVVITNLPQDRKFVQAVQFLYATAILLSMPLQLFPALRIMENWLFIRSGKHSAMVKWEKNLFRFLTVIVCSLVSWAGAKDLDKFVAFVGSFACIPLCYIYPAMLHYRACARTRWQKTCDILLMFFGLLAAFYTTIQTVKLMLEPSLPAPIGQCPREP